VRAARPRTEARKAGRRASGLMAPIAGGVSWLPHSGQTNGRSSGTLTSTCDAAMPHVSWREQKPGVSTNHLLPCGRARTPPLCGLAKNLLIPKPGHAVLSLSRNKSFAPYVVSCGGAWV
jgi:hypothetical protein